MNNRLQLGCIADDFTGATDLANNLVRNGMRVVQLNGLPIGAAGDSLLAEADAVVIALKTRTIPAAAAITQSLAALRWLQAQDAQQIYFKYCSTFDSTPEGNIGPVTEALMDALDTSFTIATPAFPDNGRSVFKGHLFVGDMPLSESGMRNHPLTPMNDANLVRVLQAQCKVRRVGLIDHRVVERGSEAICQRMEELRSLGVGIAIVDAVSNADLMRLGPALKGLPLVTAGSGVAIGLPQNHGIEPSNRASQLPSSSGHQAIISGSCSEATNAQVAHFLANGGLAFTVDPLRIAAGQDLVSEALAWARPLLASGPVLIYSTAAPAGLKAVQSKLGVSKAGDIVERCLASVARLLVEAGVGQLIVAGGETSGACVQELGIDQMRIGPQIDPGVPWCHTLPASGRKQGLHIALKSGNFGTEDFFTKAFKLLA
jgi:3-dehydrotetronate 4-kinase